MMPAATELVLGAVRDKLFGPVVMFGLGGIYVEVLKRVGFRLAPFGIDEARTLIHDTLPPKIIAGARGRKKLDVDAIAAMLVSLGRMLGSTRRSTKWTSILAWRLTTAAWRWTRASSSPSRIEIAQ